MTLRARGRKYRRAGYGVRFQGRPLLEAVRSLWGRDRDVARQEPQIRDDVAHVGAIGREGRAVHAAPEAIVHAVLDRFDRSAARAVLRVARVHPHP